MCTCNTFKALYKAIDAEHLYGLSGTPYRGDGADLLVEGILGEKILDISASELIAKKVLVQPIIKFVSVPAISMSGGQYQSVYKTYIVENDTRNALIVKNTKMLLDKGHQVLVLYKTINHGKILLEKFKDNNIDCELLSGKNSLEERGEIKERLLKRELNLIIASTIFDIRS